MERIELVEADNSASFSSAIMDAVDDARFSICFKRAWPSCVFAEQSGSGAERQLTFKQGLHQCESVARAFFPPESWTLEVEGVPCGDLDDLGSIPEASLTNLPRRSLYYHRTAWLPVKRGIGEITPVPGIICIRPMETMDLGKAAWKLRQKLALPIRRLLYQLTKWNLVRVFTPEFSERHPVAVMPYAEIALTALREAVPEAIPMTVDPVIRLLEPGFHTGLSAWKWCDDSDAAFAGLYRPDPRVQLEETTWLRNRDREVLEAYGPLQRGPTTNRNIAKLDLDEMTASVAKLRQVESRPAG